MNSLDTPKRGFELQAAAVLRARPDEAHGRRRARPAPRRGAALPWFGLLADQWYFSGGQLSLVSEVYILVQNSPSDLCPLASKGL